jgi:hypothetical protein
MNFADESKNSDFIRNYKRFQEQFDSLYWKKYPEWYLEFKEFDNEEFKPIDEYQGFYFISNYGKVISFKRKLPGIRRPSRISGFLAITLNHFGSTKLHYIHELVYTHFVGKIQPYRRVLHKDNDHTNNFYKNLEVISISELLEKEGPAELKNSSGLKSRKTKTPKKSLKKVKVKPPAKAKKPARPPKPKHARKELVLGDELDPGVLQFTGAGKFVREHSSLREAGAQVGVEPEAILLCLKGEARIAGGYQWRYSVDPNFDEGIFDIKPVPGATGIEIPAAQLESPPAKPGSHRSKPIAQYDPAGHLVRIYPSIKEAAIDMGITPGAISFSMQKPNRTAAGFTWKVVKK